MTVEAGQSTQAQSVQSGQKTGIDYNHPLFLSQSDVSGTQIISFQLAGVENYSIWYRSMRVALLGRNKLGLVDGSCKKEVFPEEMGNHWERVNAVVLSWLMNSVEKGLLGGIMYASNAQEVWEELFERFNKIDGSRTYNLHKEIATLSQGTATVSAYFSRLKNLWEEFEALVPSPGCNCEKSKDFVIHLRKLKLFQFLMGLNDSYNQARSQILLMSPMPTVNQAYGMVMSDEGQRSIVANSGILGANPASSGSNFDMAMFTRNGSTRYKKNFNVQCEFCKMKGHTKEVCYKLVGYPSDYNKFRKKEGQTRSNGYNTSARAHNVIIDSHFQESEQCDMMGDTSENVAEGTMSDYKGKSMESSSQNRKTEMGLYPFTKEQYNQIVHLLKNIGDNSAATNPVSSANLAGSLQWNGEGDW
ncbi:uncharacterized protein [Solanum tuberosum]|uniref:uncharacterized protein n=1 Tax=Solanum tuberosum TaxID=4113 RepID=UPI000739F9D2|nr:PREDICTED: uncharacterized protein LOC107060889 [Solanum tuberosum]